MLVSIETCYYSFVESMQWTHPSEIQNVSSKHAGN